MTDDMPSVLDSAIKADHRLAGRLSRGSCRLSRGQSHACPPSDKHLEGAPSLRHSRRCARCASIAIDAATNIVHSGAGERRLKVAHAQEVNVDERRKQAVLPEDGAKYYTS
jgi:hypothetical protein